MAARRPRAPSGEPFFTSSSASNSYFFCSSGESHSHERDREGALDSSSRLYSPVLTPPLLQPTSAARPSTALPHSFPGGRPLSVAELGAGRHSAPLTFSLSGCIAQASPPFLSPPCSLSSPLPSGSPAPSPSLSSATCSPFASSRPQTETPGGAVRLPPPLSEAHPSPLSLSASLPAPASFSACLSLRSSGASFPASAPTVCHAYPAVAVSGLPSPAAGSAFSSAAQSADVFSALDAWESPQEPPDARERRPSSCASRQPHTERAFRPALGRAQGGGGVIAPLRPPTSPPFQKTLQGETPAEGGAAKHSRRIASPARSLSPASSASLRPSSASVSSLSSSPPTAAASERGCGGPTPGVASVPAATPPLRSCVCPPQLSSWASCCRYCLTCIQCEKQLVFEEESGSVFLRQFLECRALLQHLAGVEKDKREAAEEVFFRSSSHPGVLLAFTAFAVSGQTERGFVLACIHAQHYAEVHTQRRRKEREDARRSGPRVSSQTETRGAKMDAQEEGVADGDDAEEGGEAAAPWALTCSSRDGERGESCRDAFSAAGDGGNARGERARRGGTDSRPAGRRALAGERGRPSERNGKARGSPRSSRRPSAGCASTEEGDAARLDFSFSLTPPWAAPLSLAHVGWRQSPRASSLPLALGRAASPQAPPASAAAACSSALQVLCATLLLRRVVLPHWAAFSSAERIASSYLLAHALLHASPLLRPHLHRLVSAVLAIRTQRERERQARLDAAEAAAGRDARRRSAPCASRHARHIVSPDARRPSLSLAFAGSASPLRGSRAPGGSGRSGDLSVSPRERQAAETAEPRVVASGREAGARATRAEAASVYSKARSDSEGEEEGDPGGMEPETLEEDGAAAWRSRRRSQTRDVSLEGCCRASCSAENASMHLEEGAMSDEKERQGEEGAWIQFRLHLLTLLRLCLEPPFGPSSSFSGSSVPPPPRPPPAALLDAQLSLLSLLLSLVDENAFGALVLPLSFSSLERHSSLFNQILPSSAGLASASFCAGAPGPSPSSVPSASYALGAASPLFCPFLMVLLDVLLKALRELVPASSACFGLVFTGLTAGGGSSASAALALDARHAGGSALALTKARLGPQFSLPSPLLARAIVDLYRALLRAASRLSALFFQPPAFSLAWGADGSSALRFSASSHAPTTCALSPSFCLARRPILPACLGEGAPSIEEKEGPRRRKGSQRLDLRQENIFRYLLLFWEDLLRPLTFSVPSFSSLFLTLLRCSSSRLTDAEYIEVAVSCVKGLAAFPTFLVTFELCCASLSALAGRLLPPVSARRARPAAARRRKGTFRTDRLLSAMRRNESDARSSSFGFPRGALKAEGDAEAGLCRAARGGLTPDGCGGERQTTGRLLACADERQALIRRGQRADVTPMREGHQGRRRGESLGGREARLDAGGRGEETGDGGREEQEEDERDESEDQAARRRAETPFAFQRDEMMLPGALEGDGAFSLAGVGPCGEAETHSEHKGGKGKAYTGGRGASRAPRGGREALRCISGAEEDALETALRGDVDARGPEPGAKSRSGCFALPPNPVTPSRWSASLRPRRALLPCADSPSVARDGHRLGAALCLACLSCLSAAPTCSGRRRSRGSRRRMGRRAGGQLPLALLRGVLESCQRLAARVPGTAKQITEGALEICIELLGRYLRMFDTLLLEEEEDGASFVFAYDESQERRAGAARHHGRAHSGTALVLHVVRLLSVLAASPHSDCFFPSSLPAASSPPLLLSLLLSLIVPYCQLPPSEEKQLLEHRSTSLSFALYPPSPASKPSQTLEQAAPPRSFRLSPYLSVYRARHPGASACSPASRCACAKRLERPRRSPQAARRQGAVARFRQGRSASALQSEAERPPPYRPVSPAPRFAAPEEIAARRGRAGTATAALSAAAQIQGRGGAGLPLGAEEAGEDRETPREPGGEGERMGEPRADGEPAGGRGGSEPPLRCCRCACVVSLGAADCAGGRSSRGRRDAEALLPRSAEESRESLSQRAQGHEGATENLAWDVNGVVSARPAASSSASSLPALPPRRSQGACAPTGACAQYSSSYGASHSALRAVCRLRNEGKGALLHTVSSCAGAADPEDREPTGSRRDSAARPLEAAAEAERGGETHFRDRTDAHEGNSGGARGERQEEGRAWVRNRRRRARRGEARLQRQAQLACVADGIEEEEDEEEDGSIRTAFLKLIRTLERPQRRRLLPAGGAYPFVAFGAADRLELLAPYSPFVERLPRSCACDASSRSFSSSRSSRSSSVSRSTSRSRFCPSSSSSSIAVFSGSSSDSTETEEGHVAPAALPAMQAREPRGFYRETCFEAFGCAAFRPRCASSAAPALSGEEEEAIDDEDSFESEEEDLLESEETLARAEEGEESRRALWTAAAVVEAASSAVQLGEARKREGAPRWWKMTEVALWAVGSVSATLARLPAPQAAVSSQGVAAPEAGQLARGPADYRGRGSAQETGRGSADARSRRVPAAMAQALWSASSSAGVESLIKTVAAILTASGQKAARVCAEKTAQNGMRGEEPLQSRGQLAEGTEPEEAEKAMGANKPPFVFDAAPERLPSFAASVSAGAAGLNGRGYGAGDGRGAPCGGVEGDEEPGREESEKEEDLPLLKGRSLIVAKNLAGYLVTHYGADELHALARLALRSCTDPNQHTVVRLCSFVAFEGLVAALKETPPGVAFEADLIPAVIENAGGLLPRLSATTCGDFLHLLLRILRGFPVAAHLYSPPHMQSLMWRAWQKAAQMPQLNGVFQALLKACLAVSAQDGKPTGAETREAGDACEAAVSLAIQERLVPRLFGLLEKHRVDVTAHQAQESLQRGLETSSEPESAEPGRRASSSALRSSPYVACMCVEAVQTVFASQPLQAPSRRPFFGPLDTVPRAVTPECRQPAGRRFSAGAELARDPGVAFLMELDRAGKRDGGEGEQRGELRRSPPRASSVAAASRARRSCVGDEGGEVLAEDCEGGTGEVSRAFASHRESASVEEELVAGGARPSEDGGRGDSPRLFVVSPLLPLLWDCMREICGVCMLTEDDELLRLGSECIAVFLLHTHPPSLPPPHPCAFVSSVVPLRSAAQAAEPEDGGAQSSGDCERLALCHPQGASSEGLAPSFAFLSCSPHATGEPEARQEEARWSSLDRERRRMTEALLFPYVLPVAGRLLNDTSLDDSAATHVAGLWETIFFCFFFDRALLFPSHLQELLVLLVRRHARASGENVVEAESGKRQRADLLTATCWLTLFDVPSLFSLLANTPLEEREAELAGAQPGGATRSAQARRSSGEEAATRDALRGHSGEECSPRRERKALDSADLRKRTAAEGEEYRGEGEGVAESTRLRATDRERRAESQSVQHREGMEQDGLYVRTCRRDLRGDGDLQKEQQSVSPSEPRDAARSSSLSRSMLAYLVTEVLSALRGLRPPPEGEGDGDEEGWPKRARRGARPGAHNEEKGAEMEASPEFIRLRYTRNVHINLVCALLAHCDAATLRALVADSLEGRGGRLAGGRPRGGTLSSGRASAPAVSCEAERGDFSFSGFPRSPREFQETCRPAARRCSVEQQRARGRQRGDASSDFEGERSLATELLCHVLRLGLPAERLRQAALSADRSLSLASASSSQAPYSASAPQRSRSLESFRLASLSAEGLHHAADGRACRSISGTYRHELFDGEPAKQGVEHAHDFGRFASGQPSASGGPLTHGQEFSEIRGLFRRERDFASATSPRRGRAESSGVGVNEDAFLVRRAEGPRPLSASLCEERGDQPAAKGEMEPADSLLYGQRPDRLTSTLARSVTTRGAQPVTAFLLREILQISEQQGCFGCVAAACPRRRALDERRGGWPGGADATRHLLLPQESDPKQDAADRLLAKTLSRRARGRRTIFDERRARDPLFLDPSEERVLSFLRDCVARMSRLESWALDRRVKSLWGDLDWRLRELIAQLAAPRREAGVVRSAPRSLCAENCFTGEEPFLPRPAGDRDREASSGPASLQGTAFYSHARGAADVLDPGFAEPVSRTGHRDARRGAAAERQESACPILQGLHIGAVSVVQLRDDASSATHDVAFVSSWDEELRKRDYSLERAARPAGLLSDAAEGTDRELIQQAAGDALQGDPGLGACSLAEAASWAKQFRELRRTRGDLGRRQAELLRRMRGPRACFSQAELYEDDEAAMKCD
ncbi:hypothetical protein BESB_007770 [Besnoitia besnoiti]|uniref:Uncharacterized protein n=1 Tax=Besnoitia besnoiti TaxID=94643 RepID=A0A2A9MKC6_BESBE|nr:hypothetical protein BESB_007770 [Besnoitia besnoiti]PFH38435.1 hypothetical protein BESB_007770 [Besnoitia besnoiti]